MNLNQFYYQKLSLSNQVLYKKVNDAIDRYDEYIMCGDDEFSEEQFYVVLKAVGLENPSLFYVNYENVKIEKTMWGLIKVWPQYLYSEDEKKIVERKIKKRTKEILTPFRDSEMDKGEIIKGIHDNLALDVTIDLFSCDNKPEDVNICGALLEKRSSCIGVSLAYKYLLSEMGIESSIILGEINENGNDIPWAWIKTELYGANRYIDVGKDLLQSKDGKVCYDYFGLSLQMICRDHMTQCEDQDDYVNIRNYNTEPKNRNASKFEESCFDIIENQRVTNDEWNIEAEVQILFKLNQACTDEEILGNLKEQLKLLTEVLEINKQYPDDLDCFNKYIIEYFPKQLDFLYEYYRYEKCSADFNLMKIVHNKLIKLMEEFGQGIKRTLQDFWNVKMDETLGGIGSVQQELLEEKKKKDKFPFNVNELNNQTDIEIFIESFEFMQNLDIPINFKEEINKIINYLIRLKETIEKYCERRNEIGDFLDYYLPESIKLLLQYIDYQNAGVDEEMLKDVNKKIYNTLNDIHNALCKEINELYKYDTVITKARADALSGILLQDGFS